MRAGLAALADGFAWPLRASSYLELANPLWSTDVVRARVDDAVRETEDARTLVLRPGRGFRRHRAGQFVTLGVTIDGARHVRTYSITSAPERTDGRITITVQEVPGGRVSRHLVRDLEVGAYVDLAVPQGEFVLPEAMPVRPLFVTGGSGITPVMSMLRSFAVRGEMPDVVHVHYAPSAERVIFRDDLAVLARRFPSYRLHVVTTRDAEGPKPRFSAATLEELCDWRQRDVYACGPTGLLDAVERECSAAGLARRLHVESFRPRIVPPSADAVGGRVCFARSGVTIDADAQTSLLRAAEDAGLRPAHGCRIGICHTCTVRLRAGSVRDVRNGRRVDEPGAMIQLCVSAASGDAEVEA
ncbi:MAG TPA: ferredoxin reductase [Candidatus Binatia bacterium]